VRKAPADETGPHEVDLRLGDARRERMARVARASRAIL
jgi:hypothetical protein